MSSVCSVILAAGDGKRMKTARPKVLGEVLFKPMVRWVADNCLAAGIGAGCVVVGDGAEDILAALPDGYAHVTQKHRRGTGHAAMKAKDYLRAGKFEHILVLAGDCPLLHGEAIAGALKQHEKSGNAITVITAQFRNPRGYGRVLRQGASVFGIVEDVEATDDQRVVDEVNSGAYWFKADFLLNYFDNICMHDSGTQEDCMDKENPATEDGEYYLTDSIEYAVKNSCNVGFFRVEAECVLGANTRKELAYLNETARMQIIEKLMDNGVNIPFVQNVIVGPNVTVGMDTTLLPGTILRGKTTVGKGCEIGPNSNLLNAKIGNGCVIVSSYIDSSELESEVRIGPMSNVRPNCLVKSGVKVGDFVELKNSTIGEKTSVAHLTYVGDSDVGARCNFGCGVVTVNYDGSTKSRTVIGDNAFIGCNTNLVAPVKVGDRVYAAAGTTITENVPDDALVIGRARQVVKENWVKERGRYNKK